MSACTKRGFLGLWIAFFEANKVIDRALHISDLAGTCRFYCYRSGAGDAVRYVCFPDISLMPSVVLCAQQDLK